MNYHLKIHRYHSQMSQLTCESEIISAPDTDLDLCSPDPYHKPSAKDRSLINALSLILIGLL